MNHTHVFEYCGRVIATVRTFGDGPEAYVEATAEDLTDAEWQFISRGLSNFETQGTAAYTSNIEA